MMEIWLLLGIAIALHFVFMSSRGGGNVNPPPTYPKPPAPPNPPVCHVDRN